MNTEELRKFLLRVSTTGYAAGEQAFQREADQSYSTRDTDGEWSIHDNWFGGEPFGGREVVFYQGKPYWMMVYYGADSGKAEGLIPFLQEALKNSPEELPVRGPRELKQDEFKYVNEWNGDLERFRGEEIIFFREQKVYKAEYLGGLVDQREDQL